MIGPPRDDGFAADDPMGNRQANPPRVAPQHNTRDGFLAWAARTVILGRRAPRPSRATAATGMTGITAMPNLRMRPGTWDAALVRESGVENRYGLPDRIPEGSIILDIGAHIGGFAVEAAGRGAVVWAFEPDPENFAM